MDTHGGIELDALLDADMLSINAADEDEVTEETLLATCSLISAVVHEVPVFNKGDVELL